MTGAAVLALAACDRNQAPSGPQTTSTQSASVPAAAAKGEAVSSLTPLSARPDDRAFRDWRVTCDNGALCTAFAPSLEPDAGWLKLSLSPEAHAAPAISLGIWSPGDAAPSAQAPLTLTIDGRNFTAERIIDADPPSARIAGPDVAPIVRALASGKTAVVAFGKQKVTLSLRGAAAAMLFIDERQGRLETPNALVRVGDQPSRVRPPDLPQVVAAPLVDQSGFGSENPKLPAALEGLQSVRACRSETSWNEYVGKETFSARLGPQQELWGVPCFAGAYNIGYRVFVTGPNGRDPMPVAFPQAMGGVAEDAVNAVYDPRTRTLSAFNKGRGLGDCGIAQTWTWTGQAFVLKSQQEMSDCRGVSPDQWPSRWRSR
ncbi:hypothetical protein LTR94_026274 [Friedmanniomyces endolithicus]|nr:hypothetical protein LTR94_026274 [Friedmanniomyces endolithicus]